MQEINARTRQVHETTGFSHMAFVQDAGKGGGWVYLTGGVAVMAETAMTAETAKTVKTATVASKVIQILSSMNLDLDLTFFGGHV